MSKRCFLLSFFLMLFLQATAQEDTAHKATSCGLGMMREMQGIEYSPPALHKQEEELNDSGAVFIIPVVFHVFVDEFNLNDAMIRSQIDVLNEDFGRYGNGYNEHPVGTDTRIRFCLAKYTPDGKPTNGIVRVQVEDANLESSNEMKLKNLSRWDRKRYLNIWVVGSIDNSNRVQGYSYLARDVERLKDKNADGIVLNYRIVGRNNPRAGAAYKLGHTCSHEVGHYLNLLHPWGGDASDEGGCDDDDGIDDTPLCSYFFNATYNSATQACNRPTQCGRVRMTENFMDYSEDRCLNVFTIGQSQVMRQAILKYRPEMVNYANLYAIGCEGPYKTANPPEENTFAVHGTVSQDSFFLFPYFVTGHPGDVYVHDLTGKLLKHVHFNELYNSRETLNMLGLAPGFYIISVHSGSLTFRQKIVKTGRN